MFKNSLFINIFFLFTPLLLFAQSTDLRFNHITTEQGLSNNYIQSIAQDQEGFIWIGTFDGLNKLDGYNIKVYNHNSDDATSLIDNYITSVFVDSKNMVWIATLSGISVYNKDNDNFINFKVIQSKDEQTYNYITAIIEDSRGNILLTNDKGWIFQFNRQNNKFIIREMDKIPSINCMSFYNDTLLFLGSKKGLYSYNLPDKKVKFITFNDKSIYKPLVINSMVLFDDKLWIGSSNNGVVIYNLKNKQISFLNKMLHINGDGCNKINCLYVENNKNLWIGDAEGIKVFNTLTGNIIRYDYIPNSNYSISTAGGTAIFIDKQQNKWIGTALGGVNFASKLKNFFNLKSENGGYVSLSKNIVSAVLKDKENYLWVGYFNEGIDKINPAKNAKITFIHDENKLNTLGHSTVLSIYQSKNADIWVGTYTGGLEHYNKHNHEFYSYQYDASNYNSIAGNDVRSIIEDKYGNLWLLIHGVGIDKFNIRNKKFIHYYYGPTDKNAIISNWNFKIIIDSYDSIWIASTVGLCKLNYDGTVNEVFHNIPGNKTSLSSNYIHDIHEDKRKNLWIGTFEGLNYFNRKTREFNRISKENGLEDDNIKSILSDNKNNIWVSTNKGISRVSPVFVNDNCLKSYIIRNYTESDGINSKSFFEGACYYDSINNEMYFGGLKGLTYFIPDSIKDDNLQKNTVIFTDFKLFYRSVSYHDKNYVLKKDISQTKIIKLKFSQNVITFEYNVLNFIIPAKNKFAYIMEGFDKKWNNVGLEHKATYTNLDPGKYTFRVKASNNDGTWNDSDTNIQIIIDPPFWKSVYALIILIIILSIVLYIIYSFIVYRENLKNEIKFEKINSRNLHEIDELKFNFFTQVSHEFRTPLTLILGPLDRLLKQSAENTITRDYLELIYKNAQRLKRLINQLLDFRKNEEGFLKLETSLDDIILFIRRISGIFNDLAQQRNITYKFNSSVTTLYTFFDPDKLDKILYNLISNAFKYTPDKGEILISIDILKSEVLANEDNPESVRIKISDTGNGIPKDSLEKIFNLFYQVDGKKQTEGTGIGLALTKELVKLHKGKLIVESEVGKGSCFSVILPVSDLEHDNSQIIENSMGYDKKFEEFSSESNTFIYTPVKSPPVRDENIPIILVVEDNRDLLYYLQYELSLFYNVFIASNGNEGYTIATKEIPNLIISDIVMPGINGIELCKQLKIDEKTSHIPVILLTARSLEENKIEGFETGADDYVIKPFNISTLIVRINNLIVSRKKLRELFGKENDFSPVKIAVNIVDEMFLKKVVEAIDENLSNTQFGPNELASRLLLSRAQLYRKIKALTNLSVSDFIRTMKLNKASEMLLENKYHINELAYSLGYTEQSNFTRDFKQQFGETPTNFISKRKKHMQ